MLDNVEINWSDPSLGYRLRNAYWLRRAGCGGGRRPKHHQVDAGPARWKFTTSDPRVTLIPKSSNRLRQLMTTLFAAGRLDGFKVRH
jgi:hypothetical protein